MSPPPFNAGLNRAQEAIRKRAAAMGHGPVWKLLMRFSGPAILSMVVAASYTVVDAIFIGRLGPEALAALPVVFPPILICMAASREMARNPLTVSGTRVPDRRRTTALPSN